MILVSVLDLPPFSCKKLSYQCDYCKENYYQSFREYNKLYNMIANNEKLMCGRCCKSKIYAFGEVKIEQVEILYWEKDMSIKEISKIYNISPARMSKIMKQNGILLKTHVKLDENEILELYVKKHYSVGQICNMFKVGHQKITSILEKNNIVIRSFSEYVKNDTWQRRTRKFYIDKEVLLDLYINQELDAPDIAERYQTSQSCVLSLLKYFDISIRNYHGEVRKKKIIETSQKRFGFNYYTQSTEFKEKSKETVIRKYGVDNVFKLAKTQEKARLSMHQNNSAPSSNPQRYLYNLIGIDINYPIGGCFADILLDNNVVCEYDGGGHRLRVVCGNVTQEEFDNQERKREKFLKGQGYKIIRIISEKDLLPSDEIILKIIKQAKEYLNSNHMWFEINIDKSIVRCSQYEKEYDFGQLRYIKKQDLDKFKIA